MKLIDNVIYLEFSEMLECGVSENYLRKAKASGTKCWHFIDDPEDRRRVLIGFDKLKEQYKEQVIQRFGHPAEYMAQKPLRDMLKLDGQAEKFYLDHRYNGERTLSIDHVKQYVLSASWLNLLIELLNNKARIKKEITPNLGTFWNNVICILKTDKIGLPTSYQKLLEKIDEYKETGYGCLIDWRFGNKLAAKIKNELCESVLLELISHPNQYDDVLVAMMYNKQALAGGYKPIVPGTVRNWRTKRNHEVIAERYGSEAYNNEVRRKVLRMRPSYPTALWESDDNHLDWWFQGDKANEYRKIKGIIVTDSFNDYVLGWAITDGEMPGDVVKLAYLNAMYHIRELTGGWYLPFEVKTDQWNISQLKPFYKSVGRYYDTPVGSKNRGWEENFFGHKDWERSQKIDNNNYTGHNITAKNLGVNIEAVKQNKKFWPHISDASGQMHEFIERLRTIPRNYDEKNKSRQQEWLEAWMALPEEKKIPITDEQFLLKFGFRHGWQNAITDQGIRPTLLGDTYAYAVPPALYMPNVGKKVDIIYDPMDFSRVLVTDNASLRFIARSMTPVAGCMADMQDGGRTFLNKILAEAKADAVTYSDKRNKRQQVLRDNGIDAESIIKLQGKVLKETKQAAELNYQRQQIDNNTYNPFANF